MPLPTDPLDLLDPRPRTNPQIPWIAEFGPYKWFRVRGLWEARAQLRMRANRVTDDTIKQFRTAGISSIPSELKALMPDGRWDELAAPQIDAALREPMRFDKAFLAVAAFDCCAQRFDPGWDALRDVRICPAIYVIDGFNAARWQQLQSHPAVGSRSFIEALGNHTRQPLADFFKKLASGYSATRRTLELTLEFLRTHKLDGGLSIRELNTRYHDRHLPKAERRKREPNEYETLVV